MVQTLQGLVERLSAPDLTAAEANVLRPRLFRLLQALDDAEPGRDGAPAGRKAGHGSGQRLSV
jgi:hypothetical protein